MGLAHTCFALVQCITTKKAAPPVAVFDRWVPRTMVSKRRLNTHEHSSAAPGVCGDEGNRNFEVRGAHSSKTATSGAASVVEMEARVG